MTVIAWDGTTLSSERYAAIGTYVTLPSAPKVQQVNNCLVGLSGDLAVGEKFLRWWQSAYYINNECERPALLPDEFVMMAIAPDKQVTYWHNQCEPIPILLPYFAIGSGCEFALAALALGCSAPQAVAVTCQLHPCTRPPIDWIRHDGHRGVLELDHIVRTLPRLEPFAPFIERPTVGKPAFRTDVAS